MKLSGTEPAILAMAHGLGLPTVDPVGAILDLCRRRAFALVRKAKALGTIWDLERLICDQLNLVIHEIHNDAELHQFVQHYAGEKREVVIACLPNEFAGDCCGILFELRNECRNGERCYVAFVDCRSGKGARRFFTRWHEIAHRLTFYDQHEMVFRRTTIPEIQRDPIERLMDMIAAELGFFEPLFGPVLRKIVGGGDLTFEAIEMIRSQFCPDASLEATSNACVNSMSRPILILEASLAHKKAERDVIKLSQSLGIDSPVIRKELRVQRVNGNEAARAKKLLIPRTLRVPKSSVIWRCFYAAEFRADNAIEDLSQWSSSKGGQLPARVVSVSVRCFGERAVAIIQDSIAPIRHVSNLNMVKSASFLGS
jgi:hypothetical protein